MARHAIILCEGNPAEQQIRLGRILDFFRIPWKTVESSKLWDTEKISEEYVLLGSAHTVASALSGKHSIPRPAAFYIHASSDRRESERALQLLSGRAELLLCDAPAGNSVVRVSGEMAGVTGVMSNLQISTTLRKEDAVLLGSVDDESGPHAVVSAEGSPVFYRFQVSGTPAFFCASSHMVDIDETITQGFFDVKDHFCSIVPLVMFLRLMFPDVGWRAQELGACLIIDDPLLRQRYGYCDFEKLRDLMRRYGFTTNIAFIPWNWRRTSPAASEFFRNESGHFSVSIHGCDHIAAEFGTNSPALLNDRARLAQSRMRNHEARTGIHHDPVMVFPQGIFSSACPEVLKRNRFLAAVNTEVVPVDSGESRTRIRDVWDIAMMTYGGFSIFTRRYASHGLENFAFDLLLGKPCLIVAHHDFLKDSEEKLIELMGKLQSLNCNLRWRPLGEVVRRACRRRVIAQGVEEVEMYGSELLINNSMSQEIEVRVRKRENQAGLVSDIRCNGKPIRWKAEANHLVFAARISPRSEDLFQVAYREQDSTAGQSRSFSFAVSVAARRFLSEFRDDYLSRNRFLSTTASTIKNVLTRAH